jgi:hypothetical protein
MDKPALIAKGGVQYQALLPSILTGRPEAKARLRRQTKTGISGISGPKEVMDKPFS